MKLVMVGGHSRNIGKTSVVEGIIRALPEMSWTAVKVSQHGHGVCTADGAPCGCASAEHEFLISEERDKNSGTDTARFLLAGARRALWVRTRQGELISALEAFRKKIERDRFVIVESNSLRRFITPALYIQVLDPLNTDFKPSAQQFFDLTDAYLIASRAGEEAGALKAARRNVLLAREIEKNKPCFSVSAAERYISPAVIEFVRSRLAGSEVVSGEANAAR
jgi:hypothetical protein